MELEDNVAPVITINGQQTINLEVYSAYNDLGARVYDNYYGQVIDQPSDYQNQPSFSLTILSSEDVNFCLNCYTALHKTQINPKILFPKNYHYRAKFTKDVLRGMKNLVNETINVVKKKKAKSFRHRLQ